MPDCETSADLPGLPERATGSLPEASPVVGGEIGPYRLLAVLGEGGFGVVYLAEQRAPIRRRVALKVIKPGMDTSQVVARFEAERQALALMDHPGVAKVYEAGTSADGRPYFVMELVAGTPMTEYCDEHRLSIDDRLELFVQVCAAVQHAHQKGIVHRDLKPSNILVATVDDRPVPKVIDFGIAKALGTSLAGRTLFTAVGQLVGTPEYMSPEQAEARPDDVDTRSDVYSLGVLLYELLTGSLPFDSDRFRRAAISEIQRIIREVEPPKPSTRLGSLGDRSTESAHRRRVERGSLERALRGDLDWITMRALEKDRSRRYPGVGEFAMDVERHRANEPVSAGPPSAMYRVRKLVRRHRVLVSVVAIVAITLCAGIAGTTLGMIRARNAEARTARERDVAIGVTSFLVRSIERAKPGAGGRTLTLVEMLDEGAALIDEQFAAEPDLLLALHETYAAVYRALNEYSRAEQHAQRAAALGRSHLAHDSAHLGSILVSLGVLMMERGADAEAGVLFDEARSLLQGGGGTAFEEAAAAEAALAAQLHNLGDYEWAEWRHRRALDLLRGESAPTLTAAQIQDALARLHVDQGLFEQGLALAEVSLATKRRLATGPTQPSIASALLTRGYARQASKDPRGALVDFRETVALYRSLHRDDAFTLDMARMVLHGLVEDEFANDASITSEERAWTPAAVAGHPVVAIDLRNRARILHRNGRPVEGDDRFRRSLDASRALPMPAAAWFEAHTRRVWGDALRSRGDREAALAQYRRAAELLEAELPAPQAGAITPLLVAQAHCAMDVDQTDEAVTLLERALALRRASLAPEAWPIAFVQLDLAEALSRAGTREAVPHLEAAESILKSLAADDPRRKRLEQLLIRWRTPQ